MKIGDIVNFQNGYAFKSKEFISNGDYKVIKIKELKDGKVKFFNDSASINIENIQNYEKYIVKKDDILFALTGDPVNKNNPLSWVGRVSIYEYDIPALLNQRVCKLNPNKNVNPKYIYYFFRNFENFYALASIAKGSASQANLSTKDIENVEIFLPSLDIQNKVVDILDCISNKINENIKINKNLEQQAQALFNQVFPYTLEDKLPHNWVIGTVNDVIELHDSKRIPLSGFQRSKMKKRIYPYYGAASLMDYVDEYIFDGTYLLLGEDGTVVDNQGYPILQYIWGQFWVNNHAHILTGKRDFNVESLYLLFKRTPVKSIITGAVQPKISQANLKSLKIVIPPENAISEFNFTIKPIFSLIRSNQDENKSLSELKDNLLSKLMSGEIDISNLDI